VLAFVVAVADEAVYDAVARPALERVLEPDSVVVAVRTDGPPQPALNRVLDELAGELDLEAVVILHEDVRLLDPATASVVRATMRDPSVAVAGVVGATGVHGLAWWHGAGVGGTSTPHHPEGRVQGHAAAGEVDVVDGIVLCLSPWATRTLRFDEAFAADFHGYDVDLCFQARFHGRKVAVMDLATEHLHKPLFTGTDAWVRNELRFQWKWIDHRTISRRRFEALR
jgi:hypothetical protein